VTFDIDANGILNVSAVDKTTGKQNQITIKNEKGRLSKEDIEKMVRDAQTYAAQDTKAKGNIEARNQCENYTFSLKNTLKEEKIKDKIAADDKTKLEAKIDAVSKWLDANHSAEKEEYDHQREELEAIANPIMSKLYAAGGAPGGEGGMPGGMPGGFPGGMPGGFPGGMPGGFPGGAPGGAGGRPAGGQGRGPTVEEVD